ncbi:MAG TPA: hypothetical protein VF746_11000 [Longimicrobium sp.]|jgi:hypothetical protein
MDLSEIFGNPWLSILWRVRKGEFPSNAELAKALRDDTRGKPLAPEVREYLAGRLDGTIRRPRGRPQPTNEYERWTPALNLAFRVRALQAAYRLSGQTRPRERAIEDVARAAGRSTDTVRSKIKSLNKAPRSVRLMIPSASEAESSLLELRDEEKGGEGWLRDYIREFREKWSD